MGIIFTMLLASSYPFLARQIGEYPHTLDKLAELGKISEAYGLDYKLMMDEAVKIAEISLKTVPEVLEDIIKRNTKEMNACENQN